ncbi:actin cortical patch SUR7/pH-response regulator pali [Lentinula guzmanii]|uniref:Actin cortical patch SUR7/pH-response regulator pali n=1 Tax=Lentinula guzmanii TaxID=2804957 RepID=A0AA38N5L1_9AGAR|nr:actin cortical patch SUR7/pH-response regulator pali [Lentinula guzmanii]
MAAGPALPGLFFVFAATVLLVFVSVSSPTWEKISFLNVGSGDAVTHYGVFGFTGSQTHIGYDFNPANLGFDSTTLNTDIIHNLTKVLILYPIAAGISGLAVLFGLCGAAYHRVGTVMMLLATSLALIVTLIVWVIEMVLFGIARERFHDQNVDAQYGNANWIGLGALVALALGVCASTCGVFGRYRRHRDAY